MPLMADIALACSLRPKRGYRRTMLTQRKVDRLTDADAGRHRDGSVAGLYLQISDRGAKSWVLRYVLGGAEHMMGLGSASVFTLQQARERARDARRLLTDGKDPLAARQAAKAVPRITFAQASEDYFDQNERRWKSAVHRGQFLSSLKEHAFPVLGTVDVAQIETGDVLRALDRIWQTKPVTADRVRRRIENVIDWAVVRGFRKEGANPAKWKGHLRNVLPGPRKVAPVRHFAALPFAEIPAFMADLRRIEGVPARALEFTVLTAARTGETLGARWDEIAGNVWTVPAERMKKIGQEHRVPLSTAALAILEALPRETNNPFIFIGIKVPRLSGEVMLRVLKRLKRDVTVHGLRSTFRDWAADRTSFPRELAEHALSHSVGDAVERSYRRGDALDKRRRLMEAWAKFCTSPVPAGDVISFGARR